jgi:hypothetical protein
LLLAGGAIGSANAAQVTYNFAGVVDYVSFASPINVGDTLSGSVTYETSVAAALGSNGGAADWFYTGAVTALHVTIGATSGSTATSWVSTYNQTFWGPPIRDQFVTRTVFSGPAVDNLLSPAQFQLVFETLVNDGAVTDALNLGTVATGLFESRLVYGAFEELLSTGGFLNSNFQGHLTEFSAATSQTPLPAALPLFASGLGALGIFAYRRKRKVA